MMLKHFREMICVNNVVGPHGHITLDFAPRTETSPTHGGTGIPIVYIKEPADDRRHVALGKFMDAWSGVEDAIANLLTQATGIGPSKIHVLMNALGIRGDLDVLTVLGPIGLSADQTSELTALLERVKSNNTKRNNIVHGRWLLEVRLYDWGEGRIGHRVFQYRYYEPSDPEMRLSIRHPENKKARDKYMYSVKRIDGITSELLRLENDLLDFGNERAGKPRGGRAYLLEHQSLDRS